MRKRSHAKFYPKLALLIHSCYLITFSTLAHQTSINQSEDEMENILIESRQSSLFGEAISASEGIVGKDEIATRPLLRTGEVLELVPGMVVTQHSGSGKANQFFLRGFNLDHGTDFATSIDGMPVNLRTHGHGQGYTDLNFIIPEVINTVRYKKGAYYADIGDFSGAGSAQFATINRSPESKLKATLGQLGYNRALFINDIAFDSASLLYAVEYQTYDGPWTDIKEDINKTNLFAKYQQKVSGGDLAISFMGYNNAWNSADQIPLRAVEQNIIDEFGSLDPSLGGKSNRYSLNAQWHSETLAASAYIIDYDFNLFSNFTFFLENPVDGDQFEQVDHRRIYGGEVTQSFYSKWLSYDILNQVGLQVRADEINEVGLHTSHQRERLGTVRSDKVSQQSYALFWENQFIWNDQIRTKIGARYDFFNFDINSLTGINVNGVDLSTNNGSESDGIVSLKGSLIYSLNDNFETYISIGEGFHSNDARGTFQQKDPVSGTSIQPVDPTVSSLGYEVGIKASLDKRLNASIALWSLHLDSELLFVGDAGNTEASGESKRKGLELTIYYRPNDNWIVDVEYAYTDSELSDEPNIANKIPGAIEQVIQTGVTYQTDGWFATARLRYFGERPLIEDGSKMSDSSNLTNLRMGYQLTENTKLTLDLLNIFDSNDHDIDYFYESILANEVAPVEDVHYHVLQPRTFRIAVEYNF